MRIRLLHEWDLSVADARSIQNRFSSKIVLKNQFSQIGLIAGADIAIDVENNEGIAGVIVYTFPDLQVIEKKYAQRKVTYPYVPGLLSFRESPLLLDVMKKVEQEPDLIVFDGQGIAHPRSFGIASHMGLLLNKPTIGCAKSLLFGKYKEPGKEAGSVSKLCSGNKIIGAVVRSRESVKPIFISPGHKIDLKTAIQIMLKCCDGYRIPKPTREADHFVNAIKRGKLVNGK